MSPSNAEIQAAIDSFDIEKARLLLRDALKQPNADTYYLASLVALDDEQRRSFLQNAISIDPFHQAAHLALQKTQQAESILSAAVNPVRVRAPQKITTVNLIGLALLIGILVGVLIELDWVVGLTFALRSGLTWLDYLTYPLAGLLIGQMVVMIVKHRVPDFSINSSNTLRFGYAAAVFIAFIVSNTVYSSMRGHLYTLAYNMTEGVLVAAILFAVLKSYAAVNTCFLISASWLLVYVFATVFFIVFPTPQGTTYPSDVSFLAIEAIIGNVILVGAGSYLTDSLLKRESAK